MLGEIADAFKASPRLKFEQICATTGAASGFVAAGLNKLALYGQVIHDLADGVYRWRQIMPVAVSAEIAGPDNPETVAARKLVGRAVSVTLDDQDAKGQRKLEGQVERRPVEVTLDADSRMVKGKPTARTNFRAGCERGRADIFKHCEIRCSTRPASRRICRRGSTGCIGDGTNP